jgi:hypothetical protein
MMKRFVLCGFVAFSAASAASATTLLTSNNGYAGPALMIPSNMTGFVQTASRTRLPGGITFSSNFDGSGYGKVDPQGYDLAGNGSVGGALVFANQPFPVGPTATVTLTFDNPVASFGAFFNYGTDYEGSKQTFFDGIDPTISAYDENGGLIGTFDLADLAPIVTPNGSDAFAFRGIDGDGRLIKSFKFGGAAMVARAELGVSDVPEPASWAMMLTGFFVLGATMRQSRKVAFASHAA